MTEFIQLHFLPMLFFIVLAISAFSSLVLLIPGVPVQFVRIHVGILVLPPIFALIGLISDRKSEIYGPLQFDSLSWLLAIFVLTIGLIVQRYSVRYLFGDLSYRKYFTLLTFTTAAGSLTWVSNDLRLLLVCWGATLLGLTFIIRLKKDWPIARKAAAVSGRMFAISWIFLLAASIWTAQATGDWQLSNALTLNNLSQLETWEKTCIALLLIVAVIIPAAQWPCQRWLLDSVVAPTPVSAVMHAGIVNAGGILLTRFAPLMNGNHAQLILLLISSISVLLGTGIMMVHVDYKRQLVGSTIAQMGFMLIQCALGAYLAAIIHAVLHGLFKSTLFLQAGSALKHPEHHMPIQRPTKSSSFLWSFIGGGLGLIVGISFWMSAQEEGYHFISAVILGWSVFFAWSQLVADGNGRIGRITGFILIAGAAIVYNLIHTAFNGLLGEIIQEGNQRSSLAAIIFLIILMAGSVAGIWLSRHRSSPWFAVVYLWLIKLGEPHRDLVESHPTYLNKSLFRGGNLR